MAEGCGIMAVGHEIVGDFLGQFGDQGSILENALAGDSEDFRGMRVGSDGFLFEYAQEPESGQNGVFTVAVILVLLPTTGADFGYAGEFFRLCSANKQATFGVCSGVVRSSLPQ